MNKGNLLDYAKVMVRNRLALNYSMPAENGQIPSFDNLLEDLPVYIRKAVIELQLTGLIPPYELSFLSIDRKRELLEPDGSTVRNNYYVLPSDFRELEELVIDTYVNQPQYVDSEYYLQSNALILNRPVFTIRRIPATADVEEENQLVMYPFPEDDKVVHLTYWVDGTLTDSTKLPEKYWDSIVSVVMRELGLMSAFEVDGRINDRIGTERAPQGKSASNGARPRTKTSFFGNTSLKIRSNVF
jgi:hypothetical protein